MGPADVKIVGRGQVFQPKTGPPIVMIRPVDALRAQRARHAQNINQVKAAVAAGPFTLVRIDEISPEQVADDFIIKMKVVEADARSEEHTSELQSRGHLVC